MSQALLFLAQFGGATAPLFLEINDPVNMLFILMTIAGVMVGSSSALSSYSVSYYAFAVPSVLPFTYELYAVGTLSYTLLTLMFIVFLGLQLVASKRYQGFIIESLVLRNEKSELIEQLEVKTEKAETASRAKTQFLAAASHDLRQPLHAMSLFLDVLKNESVNTRQQDIVDKIKNSSLALENLLESLLDISKLDAGVININIKPFAIQYVFDRLENEFQTMTREKGLL